MQTAEGLERCDAVASRTSQHVFQDAHSYRPRDAELQQHKSSVAAEAHLELMMSQESLEEEDAQVRIDRLLTQA